MPKSVDNQAFNTRSKPVCWSLRVSSEAARQEDPR